MMTYCLKCRKNTEFENSNALNRVIKTIVKNNSKNSRFIKEQGVNGLLSNLKIKRHLNKVLLFDNTWS